MSLRSWDFTDPQAEGSTCCWLPVLPVLSGVSCSGSLAVPCKGWRQEICTSEVCGAVRAHWVAGSVSSHCGSGLALQQGWPHFTPEQRKSQTPYERRRVGGFFVRLFFHFSWSFLNKKLWFFFPGTILFWMVGNLCWYLPKGKGYPDREGKCFNNELMCHHVQCFSSCTNVGENLLPLRPDWNQKGKPKNCEDCNLFPW